MNKNILLTYKHIEGFYTYDWFETVEEAELFIKTSCILKEVAECYDCSNAVEINI